MSYNSPHFLLPPKVSTGLGAGLPEQRAKKEWIEGVAIWVAVILVTSVGAANDYAKDQQVSVADDHVLLNREVDAAAWTKFVSNRSIIWSYCMHLVICGLVAHE